MLYHSNSHMDSELVNERMQFPKNDDSLIFVTIVPCVKLHLMNMLMVNTFQVESFVAVQRNKIVLINGKNIESYDPT